MIYLCTECSWSCLNSECSWLQSKLLIFPRRLYTLFTHKIHLCTTHDINIMVKNSQAVSFYRWLNTHLSGLGFGMRTLISEVKGSNIFQINSNWELLPLGGLCKMNGGSSLISSWQMSVPSKKPHHYIWHSSHKPQRRSQRQTGHRGGINLFWKNYSWSFQYRDKTDYSGSLRNTEVLVPAVCSFPWIKRGQSLHVFLIQHLFASPKFTFAGEKI